MKENERTVIIIAIILTILLPLLIVSMNNNTAAHSRTTQFQMMAISVVPAEHTDTIFVIDNTTELDFWSYNGTELIYRGKIENYSGAQYKIIVNKSMVDSIIIGGNKS